jgi:hypothetical protein
MSGTIAELRVDRVTELDDHDIAELCEATDAAIIEGGGFGWVEPQGRAALERHFRGVLLVPERELFVARLDGMVVGSAQLVRPHRNNEAQPSPPTSPTPISRPMAAAMASRAS